MIIGINGKIGSGKDTVGNIIQYLVCIDKNTLAVHQKHENLVMQLKEFGLAPISNQLQSSWEIRKFADKLKEICSLLTGIPRADFEKIEIKNSIMPDAWQVYEIFIGEDLVAQCSDIFSAQDFCKEPGFTYRKTERTYRWLLLNVGTEAMRDIIHPNIWVNALFSDYVCLSDRNTESGFPNWTITDMRFLNEMKAVKNHKGITIRVKRPGTDVGSTHPSETSLDDASFDYEINNDGSLEDLIEKVKTILITEKIIT